MTPVKLYHHDEEITMCGLGYDDPNPIVDFSEPWVERQSTYPYPMHGYHLRDRQKIRIALLTMENSFLKVSFSPDFGGRIWSAVDKRSGEEFFFHNNSFKSYCAGCGGAYIGAGMELNYPTAHSITNCFPRKTEGRENPDGSVTVTVSEWERVYRTHWQISFTLRPDEARLLQHVTFYNRSHLPGRYRYWCNASCPLSDGFRFIYPDKMASEHGGSTILKWPVDFGNDWSNYRNDYEILGMYFLEPQHDFFGYYDSGRQFGVVHHADRHRCPGKKIWTWGKTQVQEQRLGYLSEGLGYYGEFQSGRPINQEHYEFIRPQEILHWEEVWYPVRGTGDFIHATDRLCLSLQDGGGTAADMKIFANSIVENVMATAEINGNILAKIPVRLGPQGLLEEEIDLKGGRIADLVVKLTDERGCVLEEVNIGGRGEIKRRDQIREEPVYDKASSFSLYLNGRFKDLTGHKETAENLYRKSMHIDHYNPEPLRELGRLMLEGGRSKEAVELLTRGLEYNKWDGEMRYYLAWGHLLAGNVAAAYDEAAWSAGMYGQILAGEILAAESCGKLGRYEQSLKHLEYAAENAVLQPKIPAMKSAFLRNLGYRREAEACLEQIATGAIEDILGYCESFFLERIDALALAEALYRDSWRFIEAGLDYLAMGLYRDAETICSVAISGDEYMDREIIQYNRKYVPERFRKRIVNPILFLLRGYARKKMGNQPGMVEDYRRADTAEYYIFVNQPEIEQILREAIDSIQTRGNLEYYLGTYLFHKRRYDEAIDVLSRSEARGCVLDVLYRNLGLLWWRYKNNLAMGEDYLRKALSRAGDDRHHYDTLVLFYQSSGQNEKKSETLSALPEPYRRTFPEYVHLILMDAFERKDFEAYEHALKHIDLAGWEGTGRGYYYTSRIQWGKYFVDLDRYDKAYEQFEAATQFPLNFGTGVIQRYYATQADLNYYKGLCLKNMKRDSDATGYFQKAVSESHQGYFFDPMKIELNEIRFYQSLSLYELGRENEARMVLDGINNFRRLKGLIPLGLKREDDILFHKPDPEATLNHQSLGPEL